jgi:hypothetical protein
VKKRFGLTLIELIIAAIIILVVVLTAATIVAPTPASGGTGVIAQWMSRKLGGTYEINLAPNQKLQFLTWKKDQLWVLTRSAHKNETTTDIYTFKEDSKWGVLEGTVLIKESEGR